MTTLPQMMPRKSEVEIVVTKVAGVMKLDAKAIYGKSRVQSIVEGRHLAMLVLRRCTKMTFGEIGRYFGGRDHTTVLHGVKRIAVKARTDLSLLAICERHFPEVLQ